MPPAQFKSIHAVSSEDPVHCSSNLLKIQAGKKWKTKEVGEKKAYVILQLSSAQKITGIDIGNEHSAFIAVSVGKCLYGEDDFKEILILSSFMTPAESKSSTNTNRVRCFSKNALVESVANEKWDMVKVICTQPFNRHIQYGLSFVKIHVSGDETTNELNQSTGSLSEAKVKIDTNHSLTSLLRMREESPDSESETTNSLFNRWKQSRNENMSAAAAIRAASSPSSLKKQSESLRPAKINIGSATPNTCKSTDDKVLVRNRNRDDLLFNEEDDVPNEQLEKSILEDTKRLRDKNDKLEARTKKPDHTSTATTTKSTNTCLRTHEKRSEYPNKSKNKEDPVISPEKGNDQNNPPATSRKRLSSHDNQSSTQPKKIKATKAVQYKPFNSLLRGVVLVISGIQNPDRATLRQKALDLGARYKPDWDDSCTHLICAFKNTPKYNQVRGKGKIITRRWIEKCYDQKKRLPWRRYALDDREAEQPESEEEIVDDSLKPAGESMAQTEENIENRRKSEETQANDDIAHYDAIDTQNHLISSGSDTDEDIEKLSRNKNVANTTKQSSDKLTPPQRNDEKSNVTVFDASTDEDESIKVDNTSTSNLKHFEGIKFYLDKSLSETASIKIKHYIIHFHGQLVDDLPDANYMISDNKTTKVDTEFKGQVVSPLWIHECYDMGCLIPTRRYLL